MSLQSTRQVQYPRFWLSVDPIKPSGRFQERIDRTGHWAPPRPLHSNEYVPGYTTRRWFEFSNWRTREVESQEVNGKPPYKTYSFYMSNHKIWIYRSDATHYKVGDGSGNPRITSGAASDDEEDESSSESSSDDDDRVEDWVPLKFRWPDEINSSGVSYATTRGPYDRLRLQRPDQVVLRELLPDQYLATPETQRPRRPYGGLIGELPILIALIAYSVRPNEVDGALVHCLRRGYRSYNRPRGGGWNQQRGLVVRVFRNLGNPNEEALDNGRLSAPVRALQLLENGYYGKFVE
ncbi:hypothetical protein LTR37_009260 [Vermiconidia calcicola]|uniref:Uncharacterized protein n=1 Tax=Vermiconidia calcicola TaxID=1690605 RepID=A0ACC3N9T1_9PEZI|nr:hypothetical protein LTR37_009260 [Vermiconidia calcicola]